MLTYQEIMRVIEETKQSPTPASMRAMGILSDAQESINRGDTDAVLDMLDEVKVIIDEFLATKDSHGRHIKPKKVGG